MKNINIKCIILILNYIILNSNCFINNYIKGKTSRQAIPFCYDNPTCGPNTWPGVCNTGTMQSPINFDGKDTTIKILPPSYRHFYEITPTPDTSTFLIQNTGRSIEILFPPGTEPNLKGSTIDLPGDYRFSQLHFHWGETNSDGSEHRILGISYALELHIVHYSTRYTSYAAASIAPNDPNAIAILGILFEIDLFDNLALKSIIDSIPLVRNYNNGVEVSVSRYLNLKTLFPSIQNFYRYEGSLTTPDCHENRVWTVFKKPNKISKKQMDVFRSVFETDNINLIRFNHRPIQLRNGRPITFYFITTNIADWIVTVVINIYSGLRGLLLRPFNLFMNMIGTRINNNYGFISLAIK